MPLACVPGKLGSPSSPLLFHAFNFSRLLAIGYHVICLNKTILLKEKKKPFGILLTDFEQISM